MDSKQCGFFFQLESLEQQVQTTMSIWWKLWIAQVHYACCIIGSGNYVHYVMLFPLCNAVCIL